MTQCMECISWRTRVIALEQELATLRERMCDTTKAIQAAAASRGQGWPGGICPDDPGFTTPTTPESCAAARIRENHGCSSDYALLGMKEEA
jgi:hypothetical protein